MYRIATDEMVDRISSWKDNNLQIKCAREAVKLIKRCKASQVIY